MDFSAGVTLKVHKFATGTNNILPTIKKAIIMNRIYYFLTLLMLASTPAILSSCDDDDPYYWENDWRNDNGYNNDTPINVAMAQTLNGSWQGYIINEYTNDNGQRVKTQCDVVYTFVQYTAESSTGSGYETDYMPYTADDGTTQYEKQTLPLTWAIDSRTGNISVTYTESGMTYVIAYNNLKLGWDKRERKDLFIATMEGVTVGNTFNDEVVEINCERVTESGSLRRSRATGMAATGAAQYGGRTATHSTDRNIPYALHRR